MSFINLYQEFLKSKERRIPKAVAVGGMLMNAAAADNSNEMIAKRSPKVKVLASEAATMKKFENCENMEHSYSRDCRPIEGANGLTTRTLMIHRPPPCPSCHPHPIDESYDLGEANNPPIPTYNETAAKEAMNTCIRVAKGVKNSNPDDVNWEDSVNRSSWTQLQLQIFKKVVGVLDSDQLARLATEGKQHEPVHKRVIIDKSAQRMRKILASIDWDSRITQWLHGVLIDSLPPTYMASYLDILQTLKSKLGGLVEKMVFRQAMNLNQGLLEPVLENQWDPVVAQKQLKLPQSTVMVVIPPNPTTGNVSSRVKKWYQLFAGMAQIVQINMPVGGNTLNKQPLDQLAEQIISITRMKIKALRTENAQRQIVLVGFNAGAALALQVALVENSVSSVVCLGFAYNTINGVRGSPDDHILDIKVPILFVIGQNSARSSQEEMESLREKMHSETSLVVVGSADDVLRVPKSKRQIEGVTQSMVDNMVMDEIHEFVKKCITNPPGPRQPSNNLANPCLNTTTSHTKKTTTTSGAGRKRKASQDDSDIKTKTTKSTAASQILLGRPRTRPVSSTPVKPPIVSNQPSNEDLNMAIQSILGESDPSIEEPSTENETNLIKTYEIVAQPAKSKPIVKKTTVSTNSTKIKMIPSNQFVQLKPPLQSQSKIYTIKTTSMGAVGQCSSTGEKPQFFTLKTAPGGVTQYVTGAPTTPYNVVNSHKFKILKSGTTIISGGKTTESPPKPDFTSIIDMPIIFADSDGNIQDTPPAPSTPAVPTSGQFIITQKDAVTITPKTGNFIIKQTPQTQTAGTPNKVVFINRNTMKPCPRIISKSQVAQSNYSKFVVTNPKGAAPSIVPRAGGITVTEIPHTPDKPALVSAVKQINLKPTQIIRTPPQGSSGILNVSPKPTTVTFKPQQLQQSQPIVINVDSDKLAKNIIKIAPSGGDQSKQTIYITKPGSKPIPIVKTNALLNRNLTPIATSSPSVMSTSALISTLTGSPQVVTSEPKILTITTSANAATTSTIALAKK